MNQKAYEFTQNTLCFMFILPLDVSLQVVIHALRLVRLNLFWFHFVFRMVGKLLFLLFLFLNNHRWFLTKNIVLSERFDSIGHILVVDSFTIGSNCTYDGFFHQIGEISSWELFSSLSDWLNVNFLFLPNFLSKFLQDFLSVSLAGHRDLKFEFDSSRSQDCLVDNVRSVSRSNYKNLVSVIDTVQFVQ